VYVSSKGLDQLLVLSSGRQQKEMLISRGQGGIRTMKMSKDSICIFRRRKIHLKQISVLDNNIK